jgi:hypothetical protein
VIVGRNGQVPGRRVFPDPYNADTDGDGWLDGEEVHGVAVGGRVRTDPTRADTDGDGLTDPADPAPQINPAEFNLNPNVDQSTLVDFDLDGDGFIDPADLNGDGLSDTPVLTEAGLESSFGFDFSNDGTLDDGYDVNGDGEISDAFLPVDNCATVFNPNQHDSNADGIGDACEGFFVPGAPCGGFGTTFLLATLFGTAMLRVVPLRRR